MLVFLDVRDDSVAETESLKEGLKICIVLVVGVLDVSGEFGVIKVDIRYTGWILKGLGIITAVLISTSREAFKLHYILGKCASLVTEDVMNHTQLLIQVRGLNRGLKPSGLVTNLNIIGNKVRLEEVYHLKGDKQRDWHEVHQRDEPNTRLLGHQWRQAHIFSPIKRVNIPVVVTFKPRPEGGSNCGDQT